MPQPILPTTIVPGRRQFARARPSQLARERDELIRVLSGSTSVGGLRANLGVVALTIALHRAFTTPRTSSSRRRIRATSTSSPGAASTSAPCASTRITASCAPSEHDCYGAGTPAPPSAPRRHGCGARQARLDEHVVCVAGGAAFTCGVTYEASTMSPNPRESSSSCSTTTSGPSRRTSRRHRQLL